MLERGAITSGVTDVMDQEWESAVSRGQPILAELVGYGMSGRLISVYSPGQV
jgi:3-oxoacyl-(acyl-carrier-protein) synthase